MRLSDAISSEASAVYFERLLYTYIAFGFTNFFSFLRSQPVSTVTRSNKAENPPFPSSNTTPDQRD